MSDQGSNGEKNPWGKGQQDGPPDLIEVIKKFFAGSKSQKPGEEPPKQVEHVWRYVGWGVGLLAVLWLIAGFFIVSPPEQAVVLRFGKYVETLNPGPHWVPRMIESKEVINVQQVNNFPFQAEMLTKDENIVLVSLAVQYRIADPRNYLFNVVGPVITLHQATSSALRQVVGQMTLNSILTKGRQQLRDEVATQLNKIMALYKTGIEVTDVTLQPAKPPEAVTAAFDDAIKAREDEQRYINQAQAYTRKVINKAQGKVARLTQSARAYEKEVVLAAQGSTARYKAVLQPYESAPEVTRERMYLDTVANVLTHTTNVIVDSAGNNILYLPLDQILKRQMGRLPNSTLQRSNRTPAVKAQLPEPSGTDTARAYVRPTYPAGGNNS